MSPRALRAGLLLLLAAHGGVCRGESPAAPARQPTPENLAAREWFQDARFGVFIHWGVYSVAGRGEWVMNKEKMSIAEYEPLASRFDPTDYDPDKWCETFKRAGARYVTITAKHHDGFCLWDTDQTDWDVVDGTPYGKDLLKPLADACRRHGLKLFFYYSQLDWRHPDYYPRGRTGAHSGRPDRGDFDRYIDYMNAQLSELLGGDYGDVAGVWFDGWWDQQSKKIEGSRDAPPEQTRIDWRLDETYGLIHRLRPAALIGANHHITPFPGEDFQMFERDLPGANTAGHSADAVISHLPLETCNTINGSWGYRASDRRTKSAKQLVHFLVRSAGHGANLLLNVGPKPDGTLPEESRDRLLAVGAWLAEHGGAIYGTRAGPVPPQAWGVTTAKADKVFLHLLDPPEADAQGWTPLPGTESLDPARLTRFGNDEAVEMRRSDDGCLSVRLDDADAVDTILVASPVANPVANPVETSGSQPAVP